MTNDTTRENSTIGKDTLELLDRLYPGDVIEILSDLDESYLWEVYDDLRSQLSRIKMASVDYERDWRGDDPRETGCCRWSFGEWKDDDEDDWDEPPVGEDFAYSYHLLFLGLKDDRFHFETECQTIDDDGNEETVEGEGVVGCCVAICLSAPLAVIVPATKVGYLDGSQSLPDIFPDIFVGDGEPADKEEQIRSSSGEEAVQAVRDLAGRIAAILASYHIPLLPADDAKKPVPWLKPEEGVIPPAVPGDAFTVQDALFFRFF